MFAQELKKLRLKIKFFKVYLDDQPTGDNMYSAIIVCKFDENQNEIKEMKLANDKPEGFPDQRVLNYND